MRSLTPKDLGALVWDARMNSGLTQSQLGARIGASRYWVAQFERGKSGAELGLTLKALRALNLVITVEPEDVVLRRQEAEAAARKSTSHSPSLPTVDLAAILKRSITAR
jgi:transcriptional regulator with XRE-family HTH domain